MPELLLENAFVVLSIFAVLAALVYFVVFPIAAGSNRKAGGADPAARALVKDDAPSVTPSPTVASTSTAATAVLAGAILTPTATLDATPTVPVRLTATPTLRPATSTPSVTPVPPAPTATTTSAPVATATPSRTSTPLPPTATPVVSASTPVPTRTFTPAPTNTPASTATNAPLPTNTPGPAATPASGPIRVIEPNEPWNWARITPAPDAKWVIVKVRMLDPCENHMMEIGFVEVQDEAGRPLDGVKVKGQADTFVQEVVSGDKGPGKAELYMAVPMNLSVWADGGPSDKAVNLENTHVFDNNNIPMSYRICEPTGEEGNAPKHLSYKIVFRRVR